MCVTFLSCERISAGVARQSPPRQLRSLNGGWHGLAGWGCFRRLPETSAGLRSDDGADSVSDAGSPVAAADLRLAELRSFSEIPGAAGFPRFLAGKAGGTAVLRHRGAFAADQAGRAAGGEWGFPAALIRLRSCELRRDGSVGWAKRCM